MNMDAFKKSAFLWLSLLFFAAPGFAEDSEVARQTLKELPGTPAKR